MTNIVKKRSSGKNPKLSGSNEVKSHSSESPVISDNLKMLEKEERQNLTLFKSPFLTFYYFLKESAHKLFYFLCKLSRYRKSLFLTICSLAILLLLDNIKGNHTDTVELVKGKLLWWLWWIGLGFLSSCGLGTGLHTFVLYLAPFIMKVTLSAYECKTLDFPSPPYPNEVVCPQKPYKEEEITFTMLMLKTQFECILWGLGTTIGELPPYFMARSARLSGKIDEEDEELADFESLVATASKNHGKDQLGFKARMEYNLHLLIEKLGFTGILLSASFPNPLFDLAGMTCGHCLVSFWTFFGATFIGKSLIKVHIQQFFILVISSKEHMESLIDILGKIPYIGNQIKVPLVKYIDSEKEKLHSKSVDGPSGILPMLITIFVSVIMVAFALSIINAFAKDYHRRLCKWRHHGEGEILPVEDQKKPTPVSANTAKTK